jgi:hypothetical protein
MSALTEGRYSEARFGFRVARPEAGTIDCDVSRYEPAIHIVNGAYRKSKLVFTAALAYHHFIKKFTRARQS